MILLYSRGTGKTGRRLAKLLGITASRQPAGLVVVRWGCSTYARADHAINTRGSIRLAAHGYNSLVAMRDTNVPTPDFYLQPPIDLAIYPILGRNIYHRAGLDIAWCNNLDEAKKSGSQFFTRFKRSEMELRVHVLGDEVARIFKKVPRSSDFDNNIKTSLRGWGYRRANTNNYKKAQGIAVSACRALGLTFGGVDIGCSEKDGYVVYEVNTGPSLNSISLLYYAQYLERYILNLEEGYVPSGIHWARQIERGITGSDDQD